MSWKRWMTSRTWAACMIGLLTAVLCVGGVGNAGAEVEKSEILDCAFSMLEEGNIFLERYRAITGSEVKVWFENGLPYFFGGSSEGLLFSTYPQMRKHVAEASSSIWYKKDHLYVYGFDCVGYVRWVNSKVGRSSTPPLSEMITHWQENEARYVFTTNSHVNKPMPEWEKLKDTLEIGDLFAIKHGGFHVMMYIGTPRDYGFDAESELGQYLDLPLVIHCGPTPAYPDRYEKLFEQEKEYFGNCELPDGGVQISLLGVPKGEIPYHRDFMKQSVEYLTVEGQMVTVVDTWNATSSCWYRTDP